jgi:hypothetical protein
MVATWQHTPASQHSLRTPGAAGTAGGHARATPMSESSVSVVEEVYSPHVSDSAPGGSMRSPSRSEAPSPVTSDVSSIEEEVRLQPKSPMLISLTESSRREKETGSTGAELGATEGDALGACDGDMLGATEGDSLGAYVSHSGFKRLTNCLLVSIRHDAYHRRCWVSHIVATPLHLTCFYPTSTAGYAVGCLWGSSHAELDAVYLRQQLPSHARPRPHRRYYP